MSILTSISTQTISHFLSRRVAEIATTSCSPPCNLSQYCNSGICTDLVSIFYTCRGSEECGSEKFCGTDSQTAVLSSSVKGEKICRYYKSGPKYANCIESRDCLQNLVCSNGQCMEISVSIDGGTDDGFQINSVAFVIFGGILLLAIFLVSIIPLLRKIWLNKVYVGRLEEEVTRELDVLDSNSLDFEPLPAYKKSPSTMVAEMTEISGSNESSNSILPLHSRQSTLSNLNIPQLSPANSVHSLSDPPRYQNEV
ncbi:hypothetical protein HDU92_003086 [Lobulomyces angularis]|nr:hypothetical protein HDU92_003086 [Lobulomyces angularis]